MNAVQLFNGNRSASMGWKLAFEHETLPTQTKETDGWLLLTCSGTDFPTPLEVVGQALTE